jgi:putative membrane protein
MIVPRSANLARMVQYVGLPLLALVAWDVAIVLAYKLLHWQWVGSRNVPLALYGSAIGIIVGFRNNSAYARWWEARTLWGSIVNNSRSLARQVYSTLTSCPASHGPEEAEVVAMSRSLIYHQIAFVHALRQQLRGLDPLAEIRTLLPAAEIESLAGQKNVSLALQRTMGAMLRESRRRGWIDTLEWQAMDRNLDDLMDAQGGAERIKNTPMPKQYDFFPMLFVQIYCILLPVGMVEQLGWFTPLGSTLVGFMFLALDKIGRDLEDPFDNTIYDVPLTAITRTIELNLRQILGETELPQPVAPERGVLW